MVDNTWRSRIESLCQFQWKWCSQTQCISPFLLHLLGILLVLCTLTQNPLEEWRRDNNWSNILKKCHSQSLIRALYLITVRAYHADILINKQESDAMCKRHLPMITINEEVCCYHQYRIRYEGAFTEVCCFAAIVQVDNKIIDVKCRHTSWAWKIIYCKRQILSLFLRRRHLYHLHT